MRPLLAALGVLAAMPALANCDAPYTHDDWDHDMASVDEALEALKVHDAAVTLSETRDRLPCLDSVARVEQLDRFALQMSTVYFFQSEEDGAVRWANLMSAPPAEAPLPAWAEMMDFRDAPLVGGPAGASVAAPRGGAVHLDGNLLTVPRATAEVPHLVQLTDRQGDIVGAWWQDGARFRNELLGDGLSEPSSSAAPLALGVGAGTLAVASAVFYGAATAYAQPVNSGQGDYDTLVQARSHANLAVIGAGAAGAGALGLGVATAVAAKGAGFRLRF